MLSRKVFGVRARLGIPAILSNAAQAEGMPLPLHALGHTPHALRPLVLLAVFPLVVLLEVLWMTLRRRAYAWREAGASIAVAVAQRVGSALGAAALVPVAYFAYDHRIATWSVNGAVQFMLAFLAVEFAYYWMHRGSHRIAWMWATHSVHHSAEQLNVTAAIRLGATGFISGEWLPFLPLMWFGISPQIVGVLLAVDLAYQFFLHTDAIPRLGPLEWIFNTPSHHRVHHAKNAAYIDRNYGGVVIIFDRLFGTYTREQRDDPPRYGLAGEHRGNAPLRILFAGWTRLLRRMHASGSVPAAVRVALGPPR